jgi:type IV fimbrial biogenesis protein FimT
MRKSAGVTLMEMLTTIAVLGILTTLAVPSFNTLRYDADRTTAVNDFFHALFLARSEAVKRGEVVSVCKSTDHETCAGRNAPWQTGWIVFVNTDRDDSPERDPGEPLIAAYAGWPRGEITSNRAAYSFRPYTQAVVNGTIVFCDARGSQHARAIIISHTGRPRVAQLDANNKALRCASG